ncbi:uncharacterized protein [Diabrotica undecimpunctata]|uniref:uncharacterized protein n=1 Tax=Diabrotica undecimpunctata TaxID=50387 RepID=UPI003B641059
MKQIITLSILCVLAVHFASSVSLQKGTLDIIEGNCTHPNPKQAVLQDYVHKTSIPFVKRDETVEWRGDQKIYCVTAISIKSAEKGSTAWISDGGVNHTYISIELESGRGHGLEYNVTIYAK